MVELPRANETPSSTVPFLKDYAADKTLMQAAGASLLDRVGSAILIAHSQGGTLGWLWADARPKLVRAIVAIEPSGPLFQSVLIKGSLIVKPYGITSVPLSYDPPTDNATDDKTPLQTQEHPAADGRKIIPQQEPARKHVNLSKIPVLLETGGASYHAAYDEFTVMFLRQAGVNVMHLKLADEGIHGNGHTWFLELNNLDILELLEKWIATVL